MSTFLTTGQLKEDTLEVIASSLSPLVLNPLSPSIIHVTGTDSQLVTLPDAQTLENGIHFVIVNDSDGQVTIKDFDLTTLITLDKEFSVTFYVADNSTSAGTWMKLANSSLFNDKNLKLIGGDVWSWVLGTDTLAFSADAYIVSSGLASSDNTITAGSVVITAGQVAYVVLNRQTGGSPLTIQTALPENVPTNNSNILVIAYRDGNDVIVGNASFRLIDGQSSEFDQGLSIETRTLLGSGVTAATSSPNWTSPLRTIPTTSTGIIQSIESMDTEIDKFFGQLRLVQSISSLDILDVTGSDRSLLTGEVLSQELGSKSLNFSGAIVDFTTGVILDSGSNPLGLNFTPYSVPTGEYFWYALLIEYTGQNAIGQATARLRAAMASGANASDILAPYPQFPSLFRSRPLGFIQVYNNAGTIEIFKIRQLGVGGGSGGGSGGITSARAIDFTTTVLPTGAGALVVDGVTIVDEDLILYGNAALNRVYKVTGIGVALAFEEMAVFSDGNTVPQPHDAILIKEGTEDNCTIWLADPVLTPPWHRLASPSTTVWTGVDPYTDPTFDGTLRSADSNLALVLETIDKYFRGLQLRRHSTDPKRITILGSSTTKTDLTVLNFTIADRLMSFAGAEIDFETGNIYANDGLSVIGTFSPQFIPESECYWYAIGFDSSTLESDNTINPTITINYATGTGLTPLAAPKPSLTSRYTLGFVYVVGGVGSIGIDPITQASIVYIGQFTGFTDLEDTVAQNTIDIAALQAYVSSVPIMERFPVVPGIAIPIGGEIIIPAGEELLGVGDGQSIFNLTLFTVDPSNTVFDVDYILDGRWQTQSVTGDFLDGGAVRKLSATQIETAEIVPVGKELVVIKRTMSGGYPLVDLENINVNLGFVTPKTVGTVIKPASSFILKDKVTADIWEIEVRNGVFQVVKIN